MDRSFENLLPENGIKHKVSDPPPNIDQSSKELGPTDTHLINTRPSITEAVAEQHQGRGSYTTSTPPNHIHKEEPSSSKNIVTRVPSSTLSSGKVRQSSMNQRYHPYKVVEATLICNPDSRSLDGQQEVSNNNSALSNLLQSIKFLFESLNRYRVTVTTVEQRNKRMIAVYKSHVENSQVHLNKAMPIFLNQKIKFNRELVQWSLKITILRGLIEGQAVYNNQVGEILIACYGDSQFYRGLVALQARAGKTYNEEQKYAACKLLTLFPNGYDMLKNLGVKLPSKNLVRNWDVFLEISENALNSSTVEIAAKGTIDNLSSSHTIYEVNQEPGNEQQALNVNNSPMMYSRLIKDLGTWIYNMDIYQKALALIIKNKESTLSCQRIFLVKSDHVEQRLLDLEACINGELAKLSLQNSILSGLLQGLTLYEFFVDKVIDEFIGDEQFCRGIATLQSLGQGSQSFTGAQKYAADKLFAYSPENYDKLKSLGVKLPSKEALKKRQAV